MRRVFQTLSFLCLLAVLAAIFSFDLRNNYQAIYLATVIAGLVTAFAAWFSERSYAVVLSFCICILPFFGASVLPVVLLGALAGSTVRKRNLILSPPRRDAFAGGCLLILYCLTLVRAAGSAIDPLIFETFVDAGAFWDLLSHLERSERQFFQALLDAIGIVLAMLLARDVFYEKESMLFRRGLAEGLIAGMILSVVVLSGQLFALHQLFSFNIGQFWHITGRFPATFSDPNAFGVMTIVLVGIAWALFPSLQQRFFKVVLICISAGLVIAACWSGSRTLLLGLIIGAGLFVWGNEQVSRRKRMAALLLPLLTLAMLAVPHVNKAVQAAIPIPAVERGLQTLHIETVAQMLESRSLYSRIAIEVFSSAPVIGVGLHRFYAVQDEAAKAVSIALASWRDNANNFYLQILAEGGIIGVFLLGVAVSILIRPRADAIFLLKRRVRKVLTLFFLLLLTGPHLLFHEVKFGFALLLGLGADSSDSDVKKSFRLFVLGIAILFGALIVLDFGRPMPWGLYGKEEGAEKSFFWSGAVAVLPVCVTGTAQRVGLQALRPSAEQFPVTVTLIGGSKSTPRHWVKTVLLADGELKKLEFSPDELSPLEFIRVSTDRLWQPDNDPRILGVILSTNTIGCEK